MTLENLLVILLYFRDVKTEAYIGDVSYTRSQIIFS